MTRPPSEAATRKAPPKRGKVGVSYHPKSGMRGVRTRRGYWIKKLDALSIRPPTQWPQKVKPSSQLRRPRSRSPKGQSSGATDDRLAELATPPEAAHFNLAQIRPVTDSNPAHLGRKQASTLVPGTGRNQPLTTANPATLGWAASLAPRLAGLFLRYRPQKITRPPTEAAPSFFAFFCAFPIVADAITKLA